MLFNKAAIEALRVLPFSPGEDCVVVANDWHTAMLPAIIKVRWPGCMPACQATMLHLYCLTSGSDYAPAAGIL